MAHFQITGGTPLQGEIRAGGAKNAALPIMAAALLAAEPVRLENVPRLTDVRTQAEVLRCLGMQVAYPDGGASDGSMVLETIEARPIRAREDLVRRMRASFCVLGPLLARRGRAMVPLPGGCNIGNRPVDLHLQGLAALGANLRLEHGCVVATARRLTGARIDLRGPHGPTVTGTANVMSAATLARGVTTIHGAAREPEIVDLGRFLTALGARLSGLGTPTIRVEGVDQLGGASHRLLPDRIEAATLLMAVAITGGRATLSGVVPEHLGGVLALLRAAGAQIDVRGDRISIVAADRLRAVDVVARPYPGVPTDVQAQWTALAAVAEGVSTVRDRVFPARFVHVAELNRLGADIACRGGMAVVRGVARLSGARVTAGDLRASAALVLAGLAAEGQTIVDRIHHLDRGYERLDAKLRQLGARIERVEGNTASTTFRRVRETHQSQQQMVRFTHPTT
jgi:UDP-N-acetylglucosamine 1-carboxyvinyltransferase